MKTIILITGNQGTGKSLIASMISDSIEVNDIDRAKEVASERQPYREDIVTNIVFTLNDSFAIKGTKALLKELCKEYNRVFIELESLETIKIN